ncbi:MAG: hypothetical protein QW625_03450 [Candidatus Nanoarchaeia archaeon]
MKKEKIIEIIKNTIDEFNKYRSPEADAKLISIKNNIIIISFSGPFCFTCGYQDYFDDFRIILMDFGIKTKIEKIKNKGNEAKVYFKILNKKLQKKSKSHTTY